MKTKKLTNYVKVVVSFNGSITKLFVKENNVYEMLKEIRTKQFERSFGANYHVPMLSVSMRKVRIENKKSALIAPIVKASFDKIANIF